MLNRLSAFSSVLGAQPIDNFGDVVGADLLRPCRLDERDRIDAQRRVRAKDLSPRPLQLPADIARPRSLARSSTGPRRPIGRFQRVFSPVGKTEAG